MLDFVLLFFFHGGMPLYAVDGTAEALIDQGSAAAPRGVILSIDAITLRT